MSPGAHALASETFHECSDSELMDVLREKIEDIVNAHAALESKVKQMEDEKRKIEISAKNTKKF